MILKVITANCIQVDSAWNLKIYKWSEFYLDWLNKGNFAKKDW